MISGGAQIYKGTNRCRKSKVILGPPGRASHAPAIKKSMARPSYVVTLPLNLPVMYETYLAVSYEDGTSTSRELHQAYETYPG